MAAALHCEFQVWKIQIFPKYLPTLYWQNKYLDSVFKCNVQLVLSILITSFPQPLWIATDSLAIQLLQKTVFNSYPNSNWKWNCKGDNLQIFSSEIIMAWKNGSQGYHFGKFLISLFLKGLTHSAMEGLFLADNVVIHSKDWNT